MAAITVHAEFSTTLSPEETKLDKSNWKWHPCLRFPIDKLISLNFSSKPLKWIRFATSVVVGAKGHLFRQPSSSTPIDYEETLTDTSLDLYYHFLDDNERSHMFPLDPKLANERIATSTGGSTRCSVFWDEVIQRDGGRCVITNIDDDELCDPAHLVSHSKGDSYIDKITSRRQSNPNDIIKDIDDVRNGLFLNSFSHRKLGKGFAILVTPNFALESNDIQAGENGQRFTAHVFDESLALGMDVRGNSVPSGSAVRVPDDRSQWPPTVLFDIIYASAVLRHFNALHPDILKPWNDEFYPSGQTTAIHTIDPEVKQKQGRDKRHNRCNPGFGMLDSNAILDLLPYIFIPPKELKKHFEEQHEKMEARERNELEDKINSWRGNML